MESLNVGVESWIIQDGNDADFVVGEETNFALEFYPISLKSSDCKSSFFTELNFNRYKICGQVVYSTERVWVLDFGFLVFQEFKPPKFATKGNWIEGEIYLGIDPYFYKAYLNKIPDMPSLIYSFKIEKIFLETTPWITKPGNNIIRDSEKESFREVSKTNAWDDDNGIANYILKCFRIDKENQIFINCLN